MKSTLGSQTTKSEKTAADSISEDEEEDEFVTVYETDADRRRMMADTMEESELDMTSLRNQTRLPDLWGGKRNLTGKDSKGERSRPKAFGGTSKSQPLSKAKAILIEISDSEDTESENEEDAQELVKRMGLSIEEVPSADEEPPAHEKVADVDKGRRMSSYSMGSPADMHDLRGRQAETSIESGGWNCEICT